jgi:hypothetical protein
MKRRPYERPPARVTRLELERRLMKPPMRQMLVRVPPEMIIALDDERRRYYDRIPPRTALVRELLGEAMSFRKAHRPKSSGAGSGEPFVFSGWPKA